MVLLLFFLIVFIVLVGGGWLLGTGIGEFLFPDKKETFVDKSVHHHYHQHLHQNQHVSIIDPDSKKKILELKESKNISQTNNNCPDCKYFQTSIFKKKVQECEKCKKK